MISKAYTQRSNAFRAAKSVVEKSGGKLSLADVKIELTGEGYVFTIDTDDEEVVELPEAAVAEATAIESAAPAAGADTVSLVDLDQNTWAEVAASEAPVEAARIAEEQQLTIQTVNEAGEVIASTETEAQPDFEAPDDAAVHVAEVPAGEVLLCIPWNHATAVLWAGKLSKQLKLPVTIRHGETLAVQQVVEARKVKTERTKAAGGAPRQGGAGDKLATLLVEGATAGQLQKAAGWNSKPSSFYLRKLAKARGYELSIAKAAGKEPTYRFGERLAA